MDKIDLKNKLEELYLKSLDCNDYTYFSAIDAIKSIYGINLNALNENLINWLKNYIGIKNNFNKTHNVSPDNSIKEAISFFSLEESLINKDQQESINNIFQLSRVSEGTQIFEFLLEFSLKNCKSNYRYIWCLYRLDLFFNHKYLLEGLYKCIEVILNDDFIDMQKPVEDNFDWLDCISENRIPFEDFYLLYPIFNSNLIRNSKINKIIGGRVNECYNRQNKININVDDYQFSAGRIWILEYLNKLDFSKLNYSKIVNLNGARACLRGMKNEAAIRYIWSQLNLQLDNK